MFLIFFDILKKRQKQNALNGVNNNRHTKNRVAIPKQSRRGTNKHVFNPQTTRCFHVYQKK